MTALALTATGYCTANVNVLPCRLCTESLYMLYNVNVLPYRLCTESLYMLYNHFWRVQTRHNNVFADETSWLIRLLCRCLHYHFLLKSILSAILILSVVSVLTALSSQSLIFHVWTVESLLADSRNFSQQLKSIMQTHRQSQCISLLFYPSFPLMLD